MLIAVNEKNERVNILDEEVNNLVGSFYCPACQSEVRVRKCIKKQSHFYHLSRKNCDAWSENESEQHLNLKKAIYKWLKKDGEQVEMEYYLQELKQTPDLLINRKIAIEIQCSHLSIERLFERTKNYHKYGYQVIWMMGKDLWLKSNMTLLQENLMYYSKNIGFYFWELDNEQGQLRLKSLLHRNLKNKLVHQTENFIFGKYRFLDILRVPYRRTKLTYLTVKNQTDTSNYIYYQLFHHAPRWIALQKTYYEAGQNLLELKIKQEHAPIGLEILKLKTEQATEPMFCQISQSLSDYYQNFQNYYLKNDADKLYPPQFYAKMLTRLTKKD